MERKPEVSAEETVKILCQNLVSWRRKRAHPSEQRIIVVAQSATHIFVNIMETQSQCNENKASSCLKLSYGIYCCNPRRWEVLRCGVVIIDGDLSLFFFFPLHPSHQQMDSIWESKCEEMLPVHGYGDDGDGVHHFHPISALAACVDGVPPVCGRDGTLRVSNLLFLSV